MLAGGARRMVEFKPGKFPKAQNQQRLVRP